MLQKPARLFVILFVLTLLMILPAAAADSSAFDALPFQAVEGYTTQILDTDGELHLFSGILDAESLETTGCASLISTYSIWHEDSCLLEVCLCGGSFDDGETVVLADSSPMPSGFYAVRFDLSAAQEVFLTGLDADRVNTIQKKVLSAAAGGGSFSVEDISFIDTEKTNLFERVFGSYYGEDSMCWAAASSNILHYTGWAAAAGFGSTDAVMDEFSFRFDNWGGNIDGGIAWFLNGYNPYRTSATASWVDDGTYGLFAGYFPEIPYETVLRRYDNITWNHSDFDAAISDLKNGWGVTLGISYCDVYGDSPGYGHVMALWGYVKNKNASGRAAYAGLIVADSDSDVVPDANRRTAANTLQYYKLKAVDDSDSWELADFTSPAYTAVIDQCFALQPYSASLPKDNDGTHDRFNYPDVAGVRLQVDTEWGVAVDTGRNVFYENQPLYVLPVFANDSAPTVYGFAYKTEVLKNGRVLEEYTQYHTYDRVSLYQNDRTSDYLTADYLGTLPAGTYTIRSTVNHIRSFTESNYLNNTCSTTITVRSGSKTAGTLSAKLGNMGQDGGRATFTKPNTNGEYYYLFVAYGTSAMAWTDWTLVSCGPAFAASVSTAVNHDYDYAYYRLLVRSAGTAGEYLEYMSAPLKQNYIYVHPVSVTDPQTFHSRSEGSAYFYGAEKAVFNIDNDSTVPGSVDFTWKVVTNQRSGDYYYWAESFDGSLDQGYHYTKNRECSKLNSTMPPDEYDVYAVVTYTDLMGEEAEEWLWLGSIVITSSSLPAVDTYECYYLDPFFGSFKVGVHVNLGTTYQVGLGYWPADDIDSMEVSLNDTCYASYMNSTEFFTVNLLPGVTYDYCGVLYDWDKDEFYFGNTLRCTTPATMDYIELNATKTISFTNTFHEKCYAFRPTATGYYHIAITGDSAAYLRCYDDLDFEWHEYHPDDSGILDMNLYLEAGATYYFALADLSPASVRFTLKRFSPTVTRFSVEDPVLVGQDGFDYYFRTTGHMPIGSSVRLALEYGTDTENTTYWYYDADSCSAETFTKSIYLPFKPDTHYYYRACIQNLQTGTWYNGKWFEITAPKFTGSAIPVGKNTFQMDYEQELSLYSYTAEEDCTVSFAVSGNDGMLTYWDTESRDWIFVQFTLSGYRYDLPVSAGETLYFTLFSYVSGEYSLTLSSDGAMLLNENGVIARSFTADTAGLYIAACYDGSGRYLASGFYSLQPGDDIVVRFDVNGAKQMRLFQLDSAYRPQHPVMP